MSLSTISNTIAVAKVTAVLASNEIAIKRAFGKSVRSLERFPLMITTEYMILEGVHSRVPGFANLQLASDYVYDLCGKFKLAAQAIVDGGGGGSIAPVTPPLGTNIYPFVITSDDFESDGISYNNPDIVGDNLMIFINEWSQQWLFAPDSFVYTSTGIEIVLNGFDANAQDYTIVIQKRNDG